MTRRVLSGLSALIVGLVFFFAALYAFFPRDAALAFIWRRAAQAASARGAALESAALFTVESPLRAVVKNFRFATPVASVEAETLTVTPLIIRSLLSASLRAELEFNSLSLGLPLPGQPPLYFGAFTATAGARPDEVRLDDVIAAGDLELDGYLSVNLQSMKIGTADMSISGERADLMELAKTMLPLQKGDAGGWRLFRKEGADK
ncbi:MAG: hypothetical protein QM441_00415 [Synergistota bacterium]|nr:hypothetical protein [Synergistota bacterium]